MLQIVEDGLAKTPTNPTSLGGGRGTEFVDYRPETDRVLKSSVCSSVPDSIHLTEGSILRDLEITLLIIMGGGS